RLAKDVRPIELRIHPRLESRYVERSLAGPDRPIRRHDCPTGCSRAAASTATPRLGVQNAPFVGGDDVRAHALEKWLGRAVAQLIAHETRSAARGPRRTTPSGAGGSTGREIEE